MPTILERGKLIEPALPDVIPIDYIVEYIMGALEANPSAQNPLLNRLLILEARTASGKSFTVPARCAIAASTRPKIAMKTVLCTQPRILTAQEIPRELNGSPVFKDQGFTFKLGENLGFQTGPLEQRRTAGGGLLFATLGVLEAHLQMMSAEQFCRRYSIIIIDEAHERQLIFDSVIMMVKNFYRVNAHRTDLPFLILMSATFDTDKYARFFLGGGELSTNPDDFVTRAPHVMKVGGATYKIEERWPTASFPNVYEAAAKSILAAVDEQVQNVSSAIAAGTIRHERGKPITSDNRILVFVTGAADAKKIKAFVTESGILSDAGKIRGPARVRSDCVYVDSMAVKNVTKDYMKISGGGGEKPSYVFDFTIDIIIVNAVAETGLSLPDLYYVIDCGWSKESEFVPDDNINFALIGKPAAQSRIMQRRGRIGRKKDGVFVPLYTRETFDRLERIQIPEILKLEPTNIILGLIALNGRLGTGAELASLLLDVPTQPALTYALQKLQLTGMVGVGSSGASRNDEISALGRICAKIANVLPVDALASIFAGFIWDVSLDDLIAINVMMKFRFGVNSYLGYREDKRQELKKAGKREELMRQDMFASEKNNIYDGLFNSKDLYHPIRALLADDFIESLLIFRAFEKAFDATFGAGIAENQKGQNARNWQKLVHWADSNFLNLPILLDAYNDYVSTKSSLVAAGIDIMWKREAGFVARLREALELKDTNLFTAPQQVTDHIVRLKLCIYHGYKMNEAHWNETTGKYHMIWDPTGTSPTPFSYSFFEGDPTWKKYEAPYEWRPKRLVFYRSEIMAKAGVYSFRVLGISVLDGYI